MYKQYLNDYERRAEQIRKAAQTIEKTASGTMPTPKQIKELTEQRNQKISSDGFSALLKRFSTDDILLIVLLFLLINSEEKDMSLIIILGYLFISGM